MYKKHNGAIATYENNTEIMKAIILISSIFYILGLKIGDKIDLVKKVSPVEKEITSNVKENKQQGCCDFTKEFNSKAECDSTKGGSDFSDAILKPIEF